MELHPDLMDLLGAFSSSNVEYLVVGGWAVSIHSEPRFTKDLDLLIGAAPENLERAAQALQMFGAPESIVEQARSLGPDEFLFFGVPPARIDLLRSIPGVSFDDAFARRLDVEWGETVVHVISKDDLIAAKRAAGREKDLRDLRALER
ncbi:MAG: hypothetical protein JWO86_8859 [Myxococcaceae bacterium]|nr:hypothetical protein [Myxococcaceae bacterium]